AGLEEPTYSVVGDRHGAKPRRTNHDDRLVDTGFNQTSETTMSRHAQHRLLLPLYPRFEQREDCLPGSVRCPAPEDGSGPFQRKTQTALSRNELAERFDRSNFVCNEAVKTIDYSCFLPASFFTWGFLPAKSAVARHSTTL